MTENGRIDFISHEDLAIRDLSYTGSRMRQLVDLTKASFFDMGFGPRDDEAPGPGDVDSDEDWPKDRLETYVKENPRGPGYVCDVVYHSEDLPVTVYAVLVNRGQGLEVAELELFRKDWGYCYFDGSGEYERPTVTEEFDSQNPPALITSDVLRRIPIGEILARTQRRLADDSWRTDGIDVIPAPGGKFKKLSADNLTEEQRQALENISAVVARRRGRPELTDELLIEVAEAYITEAARGRGALNRMAEIFDRPEATVRDWIAQARRRGYLAATRPGRRGAAPGPNLPTTVHPVAAENSTAEGTFTANLSRERRRHILRMVEGNGVLDADMSDEARVTYVVGGLVCDDTGFIRKPDLDAALADPSVVSVAIDILDKAQKRAAARPAGGKKKKGGRRR